MMLNLALQGLRLTIEEGELAADYRVVGRRSDEPDQVTVRELLEHCGITIANRVEWLGATVICLRTPSLEDIMIRFDEVEAFNRAGGRNPFRLPGAPDWRFNWTRNHKANELESYARAQNFFTLDPRCGSSHLSAGAFGLRAWREQGFPADVLPVGAPVLGRRGSERDQVLLRERFGDIATATGEVLR